MWTLVTLLIGAGGAGLATLTGLPAAFLVGSCVAVAIASVAGAQTTVPAPVRDFAFALIGLSIGSGVTAETLDHMGDWPISLLAMAACLAVMMVVNASYLLRTAHVDRATALLSTVPGALGYVLAMAAAGHGDARRIALSQSVRLLTLTAALPLLLGLEASPPGSGGEAAVIGGWDLPLVLAACIGGGYVLSRLGVPACYLLGGMIVSVAAHLAGVVVGRPPMTLLVPGFVITGAVIGARFCGVSGRELFAGIRGGLITVAIALLISAAFAVPVAAGLNMPFGQVWVAYAPGGVEAMAAIALALGYDPAYIATHHVIRIIALTLVVSPVLKRYAGGAPPKKTE